MRIAFYKGPGRLFDKAIRLWTAGQYSHCELELKPSLWYSADAWYNRVRIKFMVLSAENWDFIDLPLTQKQCDDIYYNVLDKLGAKYDWLGIIFSQLVPIHLQSKSRWFCSETVVDDLHHIGLLSEYACGDINPNRLYTLLEGLRKDIGVNG